MSTRLPTAKLGRTGLRVARLGYGGADILMVPGGRSVTENQVKTILNTALDSGINLIDTANCYGRSEELIGKYISNRRSEYYLATKCGCTSLDEWRGKSSIHIWTKKNLARCLDESLDRLKTDYVDLMQLHNPTVGECLRGELVDTLKDMRNQGKVRSIGVSTSIPDLPVFLEWDVFDQLQIPYSALQRENEEWITKAAEMGIGTVIRGGVARGEPGVGQGHTGNAKAMWRKFDEAKLDELRENRESKTVFMLRFTLTHPDIHSTIVATINQKHLQENVRALLKGPLPADVYEESKRRLDAVGVKSAEAT